MTDLDRTLREQRRCLETARDEGLPASERAGAWMGLCDWLMEECLIRREMGLAEATQE